MAFKRSAAYPTQIATATGYPGGKAKNKVSSNDTTGTPFEEKWVNDLWGAQDAILGRGGRTRSGIPDTSIASDFAFAIDSIIRYWMQQAFNHAPIGETQQANQGKYRRSLPIFAYNRDYWRPAGFDEGGSRHARMYLYQHAVGVMGSKEDFILQPIDFPVPRLKLTGIYASFENAGDMKIRIDRRRRNEDASEAFAQNVLVMDADDYSGNAINEYLAVPGSIVHNPDTGDTYEYILTVEPSSATGTRLSNIAIEYQWIPLDISYDTLLDLRAYQARNGTASWG
jgi:hypothetical protein